MITKFNRRQADEDEYLKRYDPAMYRRIKRYVAAHRKEREGYLLAMATVLDETLRGEIGDLLIQGRPKHFFSIYEKMRRTAKDVSEIYDYLGLRVVCSTREECYTVLDRVHRLWSPVPDRTKDYIAYPKPNGYQSIHTAVTAFGSKIVEIQIRTHRMHLTAEFGTASHHRYKWYARRRVGWSIRL